MPLLTLRLAVALGAALVSTPALPAHAQTSPDLLNLRGDKIQGERVTAGPDRPVHVALRDGTLLSLGRNTELTIDRLISDDAGATSTLNVALARGTIRVIRGRASAGEPIAVTTATATVRLSGGVGFVHAEADGATEATQAVGRQIAMTSTATGEIRATTRNGFTLQTTAGQPITAAPDDAARLAVLERTLSPPPAEAGSAARVGPMAALPSDPFAADRSASHSFERRLRVSDALERSIVVDAVQAAGTIRALTDAIARATIVPLAPSAVTTATSGSVAGMTPATSGTTPAGGGAVRGISSSLRSGTFSSAFFSSGIVTVQTAPSNFAISPGLSGQR